MIARNTGGSIVTMASGAVDTGGPGLLCYGAAKAAVVQLTKTLATEIGRHGIRVNAVAPGWIRTPMTDRHDSEAQARTEARMARMAPLGRVGEPEDDRPCGAAPGVRRVGVHHRPDPPPERRRGDALVAPAATPPPPGPRTALVRPSARTARQPSAHSAPAADSAPTPRPRPPPRAPPPRAPARAAGRPTTTRPRAPAAPPSALSALPWLTSSPTLERHPQPRTGRITGTEAHRLLRAGRPVCPRAPASESTMSARQPTGKRTREATTDRAHTRKPRPRPSGSPGEAPAGALTHSTSVHPQAATTSTASAGALMVTRSGGTPATDTEPEHGTHRCGHRFAGRSRLGQLGEDELVAHFPHELGHPYVQRVADRGEQLGGCLLLPPLHLGEIAE